MITTNPQLGQYCDQHRLDHYTEIAQELEPTPGIGPITVWYDPREDFVKIEFDLDGHHFVIRGYKIYSVSRDETTPYQSKYRFSPSYGGRHHIIEFFIRGKYRDWKDQ